MVLVVAGGFFTGVSAVGFAFFGGGGAVPGVDEPYNPPLYYDMYLPDYEDSPSPFAMKDLAENGWLVYDPTREREQKKVTKNYLDLISIALQKLGLNEKNIEKLKGAVLGKIAGKSDTIHTTYNKINNNIPMMNSMFDGAVMREPDNYDEHEKEYSVAEKLKIGEKATTNAMNVALYSINESVQARQMETELIKNLSDKDGHLELLQGRNYLLALNSQYKQHSSELESSKLALLSYLLKSEMDDDIRHVRTRLTFRAVDPFDMDEYEKSHYVKKPPMGFVDFK